MKEHTIVITAGGTGGHVFPALTIALLLESNYNLVWVGGYSGIENDIVPRNGIKLERIKISGLRQKGFLKLLMLPFILSRSIYQAYRIIFSYKPSLVVSFGGYATFPIAFSARLLGIPLIIHEQNSVAGLTNRILSKLANSVLVAYKGVLPSNHTYLVGNPLRGDILKVDNLHNRYSNHSDGIRVLVLGGSLGAKFFNDELPNVFAKTSNINSIIHQVGRGDVANTQQKYNDLKINNVIVVAFIENMAEVYNKVDLVVCRSGALTVSEICAVGIAAIFIPYPYAVDNHQLFNAKSLEDVGAAKIIQQQDFILEKMVGLINSLDQKICLQMATKARSMAVIDANDKIITVIKNSLL